MKKPCPATRNDIVLTDAIKEHIMNNRIYIIKDEAKITNQIINNTQNITNYIAGLDTLEKLKQLTHYKNTDITMFEDKIEELYEDEVERLKSDNKPIGSYSQEDFLNMIHNVTKSKAQNMDDFSVVYNKEEDRMYFAAGGEWEDYQCYVGVKFMIENIIDYFLHNYEIYLIRKINDARTVPDKSALTESLETYYSFISSFGILPFVHNKSDAQIMYNEDDPRYTDEIDRNDIESHIIVDRHNNQYNRLKAFLTETQKKNNVKSVVDIIKTANKTNIRELNKRIMGILHVDEAFKQALMLAC